jgi:hypothetical protein
MYLSDRRRDTNLAADLPKKGSRRINYILSLLSNEGIKECYNHGGSGAEQYEESEETPT